MQAAIPTATNTPVAAHTTAHLLLPAALPAAACALVMACLLWLHPYDGLYGQDSYAYYYQALALRQDVMGIPQPAWSIFTSQQFRWPIGYHLHLIAGSFLGDGPEGGRLLTLALAALTTALAYLVAWELLGALSLSRRARTVGSFVAAGALMLTGTYMRYGVSLMSDVPALFWGLLGVYCFLRAWPLDGGDRQAGKRWALAAGAALGVSVLVRYGSALLLVPLLIYLALARVRVGTGKAVLAVAGFATMMLPEIAYLLTHAQGEGYSAFLRDWDIANILNTTVTGADGTTTFSYPNAVFYLVSPLLNAGGGFLSFFYLPLAGVGLVRLWRGRRWPALGLLAAWWLVPALAFSGTPYQAHRFVLTYLPGLATLVGAGVSVAVEWTLQKKAVGVRAAAVLFVLAFVGAFQGWQSAEQWVGQHAAWKAEEQRVIALVRQAADDKAKGSGQARVVSFGITAALSHYTHWPTLDFYNSDTPAIDRFFSGAEAGPRLIVLPEASMYTQWSGTPTGARWLKIRESYKLDKVGEAGEYAVYSVAGEP